MRKFFYILFSILFLEYPRYTAAHLPVKHNDAFTCSHQETQENYLTNIKEDTLEQLQDLDELEQREELDETFQILQPEVLEESMHPKE